MSRFATPTPQSLPAAPATAVLAIDDDSGPITSMSADLAAPIQELAALTQTLFASLAPASTRPPPPPSVEALVAVDDALRIAVARAREHQVRQRKIVKLEEEILEQEFRWRALVTELEQGRQELGAMIEEGHRQMESMKEAKDGAYPQLGPHLAN
jgi:mediator of RNA polymerase II transcription subunit 4